MRDRYLEEVLRKLAEVYGDVKKLKAEMASRTEVELIGQRLDAISRQVAENTELAHHPAIKEVNDRVS